MQVSTLPAHVCRTSQADTAPYHPASLIELQNSFDSSAVTLNIRFPGVDSHSNGSHGFEMAETILPPTDAAVILDDHLGNWHWAPSITSFPSTVADLPPMFDLADRLPMSQTNMTDFSDFNGPDNISEYHTGLSDSVSDELQLGHAGRHPFSL